MALKGLMLEAWPKHHHFQFVSQLVLVGIENGYYKTPRSQDLSTPDVARKLQSTTRTLHWMLFRQRLIKFLIDHQK